jgi:acyl carrier protein
MSTEKRLQQVESLIRESIGTDESGIDRSTDLANDLGMDSMKRIDLLLKIEEAFAVSISDDQIDRFVRVGDIVDFIEEYARS